MISTNCVKGVGVGGVSGRRNEGATQREEPQIAAFLLPHFVARSLHDTVFHEAQEEMSCVEAM